MNKIDPTTIVANDIIKMIIEIPEIWMKDNDCGLFVVVKKVLVKKAKKEYMFEKSEESDDIDMVSLLATKQIKTVQPKKIKDNINLRNAGLLIKNVLSDDDDIDSDKSSSDSDSDFI